MTAADTFERQDELNERRELHRVDFKVRPSEDHPLFRKSACGALSLWIYAASPLDAVERCWPFLAALPFELVDQDEAQITSPFRPSNEAERIVAEQAELTGIAQFYDAYDDEAEERDIPFPGEETA